MADLDDGIRNRRIAKGLCICCGVHPHVTPEYYCNVCRFKVAPMHTQEDVRDRIVVLVGVERNLRSRLLSVRQPSLMLDRAEALEKEAERLFDAAQAIRRVLEEDTEKMVEISDNLAEVVFERDVLEFCVRQGIKPKRIRKVVERAMKEARE